MSMVGKVGVLLYEFIQNRNQIIVTYADMAVLVRVLQLRLSFFVQHHFIGKTASLHVDVVIDVVLGHDEGLFSFRQHDLLLHHFFCAVGLLLHLRDIVQMNHNISAVIHFLNYFFKFRNRGHHGIILSSLMRIL